VVGAAVPGGVAGTATGGVSQGPSTVQTAAPIAIANAALAAALPTSQFQAGTGLPHPSRRLFSRWLLRPRPPVE
jgi:hypothetical protein